MAKSKTASTRVSGLGPRVPLLRQDGAHIRFVKGGVRPGRGSNDLRRLSLNTGQISIYDIPKEAPSSTSNSPSTDFRTPKSKSSTPKKGEFISTMGKPETDRALNALFEQSLDGPILLDLLADVLCGNATRKQLNDFKVFMRYTKKRLDNQRQSLRPILYPSREASIVIQSSAQRATEISATDNELNRQMKDLFDLDGAANSPGKQLRRSAREGEIAAEKCELAVSGGGNRVAEM
ncbi:MAG: hypothetical protein Q9199_001892 [Rusavskia elegans]